MKAPTRPVLRYHGGKWLLAKWIISNMPEHRCYVEPFGGGASVLLQKPRVAAECYNDLDGRIVDIFRCLQDPRKAEKIRRRLSLTPFARDEFDKTYEPAKDDIDSACKLIARSFMGYGTDSTTRTCRTGFRAKFTDGRVIPAADWSGWPSIVPSFVERLRGVVIEKRDAFEILQRFDGPGTLFYVDPPYVASTRSSIQGRSQKTHGYRFEMGDEDHRRLSASLHSLSSMVMLSGYESDLYSELYGKWTRLERRSMADGARKRKECLWMNPAALKQNRRSLFSEACA